MNSSRLLLLIVMVMTPSECSGSAEPQCEGFDVESFYLLEGEAFYFEPYALDSGPLDKMFTWFRKNNNNKTENITSDENEDVHHHGGALFFLNPLIKDSGFYTARQHASSGQCYDYYANFDVSPTVIRRNLYPEIKNSDVNKRIPCPDPIQHTCAVLNGSFTWNKDSKLLQDNHKDHLWIYNMAKADEGIYTCICTWTHNGKEYKSSGSRSLEMEDLNVHRDVMILAPANKEYFAEEGAGLQLTCSVFCGTNVKSKCKASWRVDAVAPYWLAGYNETMETVNLRPSSTTISTAILTIDKVSAQDFKATFECRGQGMYKLESVSLNLKRRETIVPLFVGGVCVLIFCVFAAMLVKCFAIELVLFFRPCFPFSCCDKDGRLFDAYVVYQMQSPDKVTEDTLGHFVAKILPSVLEDKCGYRLFIHGRDDVPGEDRLELVEDRMKQSRRLMVILTPGSGSESESSDQHSVSPQNPEIGGFDWQVGLHHVLLQREMSVILIQLGDQGPQGYTHLPAGLQHLILKNAPIRWPEGSRGAGTRNSRFWKRVRYLMPATPAKRCPQSAVI
ncbi:interleukin-1 receptor type 1 isoform X2 [Cyclopterus lumpus]|uniref:Interleukin 1 receptor 4 n=2 Tax=Cyclopterus lumpus TaxID=8103 RepID=A0A6M3RBN1_CYCLU|nr:interleukin-1 receptor type 1 isoform X2 [Cyclopterus lumpus]QJD09006.1 interleukin 1 receptor 4 [Cyclopterus lumpus]